MSEVKTTVLVLDDDEGIRTQYRWLLSGHRVVSTGTRPEAVEACVREHPVVAIVDLKFGTQLFRSRTASGYVKKAGTAVWARLDEKQTHFFDDRTGESLRIRL